MTATLAHSAPAAERTSRALAPRVLIAAALAGPFWTTWIGAQQISVGRLLLVALVAAIVMDLRSGAARTLRPWRGVALLATGFVGLLAWTALSSASWGCFCSGTTQGFGDLVALTLVASFIGLYATPREAIAALGAAAVGVLLAGGLSVVGLRDLHANAYTEGSSAARLEGVYGNSNFLGFALALGIPIGALGAFRLRGAQQLAAVAATLAGIVLLYVTFSRGSLIATAFGVAAVLWVVLTRGSARGPRHALTAGAAVLVIPALTIGLITTPFYKDARVRADFGAQVDAPVVDGTPGPGGSPGGAGHSGTQKEALHAVEGEYMESRSTGVRLASEAFREQPLRGIGMDRFPTYADTHAEFGLLPTHNYYAQVAAELGLVGILLFVFSGLVVLLALVRGRSPVPLRAALAGVVAVGIVNLVFINGLANAGMTMPLVLGMAFAVGWAGTRADTDGPDDQPAAMPPSALGHSPG